MSKKSNSAKETVLSRRAFITAAGLSGVCIIFEELTGGQWRRAYAEDLPQDYQDHLQAVADGEIEDPQIYVVNTDEIAICLADSDDHSKYLSDASVSITIASLHKTLDTIKTNHLGVAVVNIAELMTDDFKNPWFRKYSMMITALCRYPGYCDVETGLMHVFGGSVLSFYMSREDPRMKGHYLRKATLNGYDIQYSDATFCYGDPKYGELYDNDLTHTLTMSIQNVNGKTSAGTMKIIAKVGDKLDEELKPVSPDRQTEDVATYEITGEWLSYQKAKEKRFSKGDILEAIIYDCSSAKPEKVYTVIFNKLQFEANQSPCFNTGPDESPLPTDPEFDPVEWVFKKLNGNNASLDALAPGDLGISYNGPKLPDEWMGCGGLQFDFWCPKLPFKVIWYGPMQVLFGIGFGKTLFGRGYDEGREEGERWQPFPEPKKTFSEQWKKFQEDYKKNVESLNMGHWDGDKWIPADDGYDPSKMVQRGKVTSKFSINASISFMGGGGYDFIKKVWEIKTQIMIGLELMFTMTVPFSVPVPLFIDMMFDAHAKVPIGVLTTFPTEKSLPPSPYERNTKEWQEWIMDKMEPNAKPSITIDFKITLSIGAGIGLSGFLSFSVGLTGYLNPIFEVTDPTTVKDPDGHYLPESEKSVHTAFKTGFAAYVQVEFIMVTINKSIAGMDFKLKTAFIYGYEKNTLPSKTAFWPGKWPGKSSKLSGDEPVMLGLTRAQSDALQIDLEEVASNSGEAGVSRALSAFYGALDEMSVPVNETDDAVEMDLTSPANANADAPLALCTSYYIPDDKIAEPYSVENAIAMPDALPSPSNADDPGVVSSYVVANRKGKNVSGGNIPEVLGISTDGIQVEEKEIFSNVTSDMRIKIIAFNASDESKTLGTDTFMFRLAAVQVDGQWRKRLVYSKYIVKDNAWSEAKYFAFEHSDSDANIVWKKSGVPLESGEKLGKRIDFDDYDYDIYCSGDDAFTLVLFSSNRQVGNKLATDNFSRSVAYVMKGKLVDGEPKLSHIHLSKETIDVNLALVYPYINGEQLTHRQAFATVDITRGRTQLFVGMWDDKWSPFGKAGGWVHAYTTICRDAAGKIFLTLKYTDVCSIVMNVKDDFQSPDVEMNLLFSYSVPARDPKTQELTYSQKKHIKINAKMNLQKWETEYPETTFAFTPTSLNVSGSIIRPSVSGNSSVLMRVGTSEGPRLGKVNLEAPENYTDVTPLGSNDKPIAWDVDSFGLSPSGTTLFFMFNRPADEKNIPDPQPELHQIWAARRMGSRYTRKFPIGKVAHDLDSLAFFELPEYYVFVSRCIINKDSADPSKKDMANIYQTYVKKASAAILTRAYCDPPAAVQGGKGTMVVALSNVGNVVFSAFDVQIQKKENGKLVGSPQTVRVNVGSSLIKSSSSVFTDPTKSKLAANPHSFLDALDKDDNLPEGFACLVDSIESTNAQDIGVHVPGVEQAYKFEFDIPKDWYKETTLNVELKELYVPRSAVRRAGIGLQDYDYGDWGEFAEDEIIASVEMVNGTLGKYKSGTKESIIDVDPGYMVKTGDGISPYIYPEEEDPKKEENGHMGDTGDHDGVSLGLPAALAVAAGGFAAYSKRRTDIERGKYKDEE